MKRVISDYRSRGIATACMVIACLLLYAGSARGQSGSTEHIFYIDTSANLDELWWSLSTGWVFAEPFGGGNMVAVGSSQSGFRDSSGEHAFFLDPNQHVHQLFWSSGSGWENQDLTAMTGDFAAMAGTGLASFSDSRGEHLFYLEGTIPTACVTQLFWSSSTGWERQPLICNVNGGALTGFSDSNGEHAFYFNSDGTIHELLWTISTGWHDQRLPSFEESFSSQDGLASFSDSRGEHVFYVGGNGTVRQLFWTSSAGWTDQSLPSSLLAQSGAALTAFSDSHGESVFYVSAQNNLPNLLRWSISNGWQNVGLPAEQPVATNSPLTSFSDGQGEHLIYLVELAPQCHCNPSHVLQDFASNGTTFNWQDLSSLSNAVTVPIGYPNNPLSSLGSFD